MTEQQANHTNKASETLVAGVARIDITPKELKGLNPFGPDFLAVHDPLFARALVIGNGDFRSVVVTLDLVEVGDTTDIRKRIEAETGIAANHVMFAPSHAHNAPRIGLVTLGGKARIPSPESLVYTEIVYDAAIEVIRLAMAVVRPVRMGRAKEAVDVNISREEYVGDKWTLGYAPDGVSDKTLNVISLFDEGGALVAALLNYAVHPTVMLGLRQVSGDLAGATCAYVEHQFDDQAEVFWLSGALGDQAPKADLGQPTDDPVRDLAVAEAALHAQSFMLGATAVRLIHNTVKTTASAKVTADIRVIPCPVRRLEVPPGMEQANVDAVDLTLTCITIGSVALAGVSGEVTVPVGRTLLDASPLSTTLIVSNANARIGYLPTDESYDRKTHAAGGCPIVQGHAQRSIANGMGQMIEASIRYNKC